jgi:hypothetical protein
VKVRTSKKLKGREGIKLPRMRPIRRDKIEEIRAKAKRHPSDLLEVMWDARHGDQTAHFVLRELVYYHLKRGQEPPSKYLDAFGGECLLYRNMKPFPEWWPIEHPDLWPTKENGGPRESRR